MAETTTTELGLTKATPGTHQPFSTAEINTNWDAVDALFNATTGHDHSAAHKGAPIPTAALAALGVTGAKIATNTVTGDKLSLGQLTNSLGADVNLNNTANYFDGPSIAQGASGLWFVTGQVTLDESANTASLFMAKLWDGTTVIDSGAAVNVTGIGNPVVIHLSGYLNTPAGNLRISARDSSATTGRIRFNVSGNSKDSTISAFRIG